MLIDEKINIIQRTRESSKSVNSSKQSQDSKPIGKKPDSSKLVRTKPLQKPKLKCELCNYTNHLTDDCYRILYCIKCKKEDHMTSDHDMYIQGTTLSVKGGVLAESSQSSKSSIGVSCTTCGSSVHSTTDHNDSEHFKRGDKLQATKAKEPTKSGCSRSMIGVKSYLYKYVEQPGSKVVFGDNLTCITEGYSSINYGGIIFSKQGIIFNAKKEIVLIAPRRNDVYVLDMSSLTPNGACFFAKALEMIALNEQDNPHTEDVEGHPDPTNTEGTQEQNYQDTNHASISSYPIAQDRWSRDQHIKLVNINSDPGKGMLTRIIATKLTAASASECLFADFFSEIEPKKVSEALKNPGWVDAMQEELNQFYRNKVWTLVPLPYEKYSHRLQMGVQEQER
ncbi:hypothetical protein Tco_0591511 [Tanacetum coccineum]